MNNKNDNRIGRGSKKLPKVVKTIPLSLAVAALTTGAAFAADFSNVDVIQVNNPDGTFFTININNVNADGMESVRAKLKAAFKDGTKQVILKDTVKLNVGDKGNFDINKSLHYDKNLIDEWYY